MSEPDQVEAVEGEERRKPFKPSASNSVALQGANRNPCDLLFVHVMVTQRACLGFCSTSFMRFILSNYPAQRVP